MAAVYDAAAIAVFRMHTETNISILYLFEFVEPRKQRHIEKVDERKRAKMRKQQTDRVEANRILLGLLFVLIVVIVVVACCCY